jgi:uncharacterized protein (DUF983 family)
MNDIQKKEVIMNCPNCGAGQELGFASYRWGKICRHCGYGMTFNGKRYLPGRGNRASQAFFAIVFAVAIIIIAASIAHNTPGPMFSHTSTMFRTDKVARMAMTEQSKIWHSVFQK